MKTTTLILNYERLIYLAHISSGLHNYKRAERLISKAINILQSIINS